MPPATVSYQQARRFSNELNFISARLIITSLQECLELGDMLLRKPPVPPTNHTTPNVHFDV